MKLYSVKIEVNGAIHHTRQWAFTLKGAVRKAEKKFAK